MIADLSKEHGDKASELRYAVRVEGFKQFEVSESDLAPVAKES